MNENVPVKKSNARLAVLRNTVAQGATDAEFAMFLEICKATKLNPFKREIWFIKGKDYINKRGEKVEGRLQIMTGIAGYLAIANAHPQFDGIEQEIVRKEDGKIDYAIAKVWRKDRKFPSVGTAYFEEYYRPGNYGKDSIWDKNPSTMILKVAKSIALREAFPQELSGLHTEDEIATAEVEPPKLDLLKSAELLAHKNEALSEDEIDEAMEKVGEDKDDEII